MIDNGVWYIMPRKSNVMYKSTNMGNSWESVSANIPEDLFGVYKCGNIYFGGDDKNSGTKYHKSTNLADWETLEFGNVGGTATLCETSFCQFDGKTWAFNRTNDATLGHPVILVSNDNGTTWTKFSDSLLHGYRSTVSCLPFGDYIIIADIDRDNGILYYSKFDGQTITEMNTWEVPCAGDDFHNVNIATNFSDTIILEFMHAIPLTRPSTLYVTNYACDNVMLIGSTKSIPSVNVEVFDTTDKILNLLNTECNVGTNGTNYDFVLKGGVGIRYVYPSANTEFYDEIVFPLDVCSDGTYAPALKIMEGDKFVKPTNNNLNMPTLQQSTSRAVNEVAKVAYVDIGEKLYSVHYNPSKLTIFTRCEGNFDVTAYTVASGYNQIYGQTWQKNKPLRKMFPVQENSSSSVSVGLFSNMAVNSFASHPYYRIRYNTAR